MLKSFLSKIMNNAGAPQQQPASAPAPVEKKGFEALGLHPDILKGIHDLGFVQPTPIQAQAIPHILAGRDLIGLAQTGTGKTAAFVLPLLHRLMPTPSTGNMRALIISPTREIALQSTDHLKALSRYVPLKGAPIFGGVDMSPQIQALASGVDVVSATPGRLLDHIYSARIRFKDLQILVLDEVDRMLDMGFKPDILRIISFLPEKRQNLAFSATMPPEILNLLKDILKDPVTVQVARTSSAAVGIRHAVYQVPRHLKTDLLVEILKGDGLESVIIFTRTKRDADKLYRDLRRKRVRTSVIHGDLSQTQRMFALEDFRSGHSQVLVATDVAARGIDISDITHVINYDMPNTPEDYVHRIGRTARGDATGDAFSLVARDEERLLEDIEKVIKKSIPRVTMPGFDYKRPAPAKPQGGHGHGHGHGRHRSGPPRHGR